MAKKKLSFVYVVMHYEFFTSIDSMVFHISSSLKEAEKYIEKMIVCSSSWWEVLPMKIDQDINEELSELIVPKVFYYNYKGKSVKRRPVKQAIVAFGKKPI